MKHISINLCIVIILAFLSFSCSESDPRENLKVDVSDINVKLKVKRLDQDLLELDTGNLENRLETFNLRMLETYGTFWYHYVGGVLRLGNPEDPMFTDNYAGFLRRPYVFDVMYATDSVYGKEIPELDRVEDGFKHLKYYYPQALIPEVVTSYNFFNYACVATDSTLNIGLDFYLGSDHWIVKTLPGNQFADFIKEDMDRKYMAVDAISVWYESHYLGDRKFDEFADAMIHYGKLMYALDALLPDVPDHIKIKYSVEEMEWAYGNEHRTWLTMVDRKLIHSTKSMDIKTYFDDAPFTAGLKDDDAPERIGVFIGWQVVRDYMEANQGMTLVDLMKETNNQKILSKYKQGKEE